LWHVLDFGSMWILYIQLWPDNHNMTQDKLLPNEYFSDEHWYILAEIFQKRTIKTIGTTNGITVTRQRIFNTTTGIVDWNPISREHFNF